MLVVRNRKKVHRILDELLIRPSSFTQEVPARESSGCCSSLRWKKGMANLCDSANNGGEGTYDVLYLTTGYEPKAHDFDELQNSSVPFSFKIPIVDQDVDDLTLGKMLTEAYRGQVDYFVQGGMSVSQSSSVMFDGSGQPDGEMLDQSVNFGVTRNTHSAHSKFSENTRTEKMVDRSGKPDERNSSKAQIRTLLEEQRQTIIAEYQEKVSHHELQAAQARRRAPTPTRTTMATEIGISRSSSTESSRDGRITEISEFCLRYYCEKKTHRGSEHYFGTFRQSTGVAK